MRYVLTPQGPFSGLRGFLSPLTWPASQLWSVGAQLRAVQSYRHRLDVPVISVGNLQVGGTGKTPMALGLMARLRDHFGRQPALVSRGYGRRAHDTHLVRPDSSVSHSGDEPLLIAQAGFAVAVGPDRVAAARLAIEQADANVIVLDDGFQQRDLVVDLQLVLWDAARAGSDACLPYGCLRAPIRNLRRADLVVLRRDPGEAEPPAEPDFGVASMWAGYGDLVFRDVRGVRVAPPATAVVAAGIGNPERLTQSLRRSGVVIAGRVALPDHCVWDERDCERVRVTLSQCKADALVITAKDAVKRSDWDTLFLQPVRVAEAKFGPCTPQDLAQLDTLLESVWQT